MSSAIVVAVAEAPCVFQCTYLPDKVDYFKVSDRLPGRE